MKKLICVPLLALAIGCFGTMDETVLPPPPPPMPPVHTEEQEQPATATGWLRSLSEKDTATFADGLRAVAMLTDEELVTQPWTTLKGRLMERGIVPAEWNYLPASGLTKGHLSYILVEALNIEGGVMLHILPNWRRYAFRECRYVGLVVGNFHEESVSGPDLLGVLGKADIYLREGNLDSIRRP